MGQSDLPLQSGGSMRTLLPWTQGGDSFSQLMAGYVCCGWGGEARGFSEKEGVIPEAVICTRILTPKPQLRMLTALLVSAEWLVWV